MVRVVPRIYTRLAQNRPLIQQKKAMIAVRSPTSANLFGIELITRTSGWIVGDGGTILKLTSDGWSAVTSPTSNILLSVSVEPSSKNAFAVGASGTIVKYDASTDTWALDSQSGDITTANLFSVFYASSSLALSVGTGGVIIKFDGTSWATKSSGVSSHLLHVFISSNYSLAVGYNGVILKSTDNGETWVKKKSGVTNDLWACFISGDEAWAVGTSGIILHSTDSGETWNVQPSGVSTTLNGIFMFSTNFGIIVGDYGVVLSYDGSSWVQEESATPNWLFGIWSVATDFTITVGYAGSIYELKAGTFPNIIQNKAGEQVNPVAAEQLPSTLTTADNLKVSLEETTIKQPIDIQDHWQENVTISDSSAKTASGNTDDIDVGRFNKAEVCVDVTAVSGTTPTLDVYLEGKDQLSGKYKEIWHPAQITAVTTVWLAITDLAFKYIRLRWVVGGTSPSFSFSASGEFKS